MCVHLVTPMVLYNNYSYAKTYRNVSQHEHRFGTAGQKIQRNKRTGWKLYPASVNKNSVRRHVSIVWLTGQAHAKLELRKYNHLLDTSEKKALIPYGRILY